MNRSSWLADYREDIRSTDSGRFTQIDGGGGGMGAGAMAEVDCRQWPMAEVSAWSCWREVAAKGMLAGHEE